MNRSRLGCYLFFLVRLCDANAFEGPGPLKDIKILSDVSVDAYGAYKYQYSLSNPSSNDGLIRSIDIFLSQNSSAKLSANLPSFTHCSAFLKTISANAVKDRPMTPVGSTAPPHWLCGYGTLPGFADGSYGWGARGAQYMIKPGPNQSGFSLTSMGPPAIRDVLIQPWIDLDNLPAEYNENVQKMELLENKVRWTGKTIGPQLPPKVLVKGDLINNLISLKDQCLTLGWIKETGIANSLGVKLSEAKSKIASGDFKAAKNILGAFQSEVKAQNGKQITAEAYGLLFFNAKYLIDNL